MLINGYSEQFLPFSVNLNCLSQNNMFSLWPYIDLINRI
jgi:hypothetical protein